jgi:sigma-B regulation protein RsbU (phosphoserine phosphatase)
MAFQKTAANTSFDSLAGSTEFLNIVLNNINSCILMLDSRMRLQAFNNVFRTIFTNKENEDLMYRNCGEAIGCAHQINEAKECGETTHCNNCELRLAAFDSYLNNKTIYKEKITRPFMNKNFEKENKDLQFSTRLFVYKGEKYIIMIIEDITNIKHYC